MVMQRVDTTIASAGTGKTYRLVNLLADTIANGIAPERILGTTFTVKAADELVERARANLISQHRMDEATRLLGARMGTINSVCGGLVADFALDLGRSPTTEVISEESGAFIFAVAADEAIAKHAPTLNALSQRFGMAGREDWKEHVLKIIELARANGLGRTGIEASSARSINELLKIMPDPADEDGSALNARILRGLEGAISELEGVEIPKTSKDSMADIFRARAALARGEALSWDSWAKLSKLKTTKAVEAAFDDVKRVAAVHQHHPQLRADLVQFTNDCFACAADALENYQTYKSARGLLDFTDQEALGLAVLRTPHLRERLAERIGAVFVDEVQDSSPLQVAIFTELARIAERSTWVGDPKQAIYGFRNTDPQLTLAAARAAAADTGGSTDVLSKSWRSRPGITAFVNHAFVPKFVEQGLPQADCTFSATACEDAEFEHPPLAVFEAEGRNAETRAAALASGVAGVLNEAEEWAVRSPERLRNLAPGDVAILCRSRDQVGLIASALHKLGFNVAVEHDDLYGAPEVQLVLAAFAWVVDRKDTLALAEMARLTERGGAAGKWLSAALHDRPDEELLALLPFRGALEELRQQQMSLTPAELLDGIVETAALGRICCEWGEAAARIDNIEALRALARSYQDESSRLQSPATPGGFLLWLNKREAKRPRSLDPNAIQVMTYHGAKGLEWPVVVLTDLEKEVKSHLFEPTIEVDGQIDWREPLAGRWIRYWPWPYGRQSSGVVLDERAADSELGQAVLQRNREEAVRLLYVGATRARDYLVLARSGRGQGWLDELTPTGEDAHIRLPTAEGECVIVGGSPHPARLITCVAGEEVPQKVAQVFLSPRRDPKIIDRLRLRPSDQVAAGSPPAIKITHLGPRISISGDAEMSSLGQAVHGFLASDRSDRQAADRQRRAQAILDRWQVSQIAVSDVVVAADAFWEFVSTRFPEGTVRREVPVFGNFGDQLLSGKIDLLIEGTDWLAIVDHKTFPGPRERWPEKAGSYAPQLALYARAAELATSKPCRDLMIHLPVAGSLLELDLPV